MSGFDKALDDYQQFTATTAQYPQALALPYLALGLGDEAGELLEKAIQWKMGSAPAQAHQLLAEAGDVSWYLAQLLTARNARLSAAWALVGRLDFEASLTGSVYAIVLSAAAIQGRIKKHLRDGAEFDIPLLQHANRILRAIDMLATTNNSHILGVLQANRIKLVDRLARNTIKGEGDAR